ncbi:DUF2892 domain-containing protein [Christiangramia fulva]|uniref:DUF2892 domain-containing protein n=1 Tax=Christiangramia fulva TaxID=2126553 RepID=A0A2R3Z2U9_9FLAO|nr:DUF2892 domain-containing protein [Christiangramia fulva]AVR44576.1 DUF2892 domain-containing protein [Christiangramia fulva]
MKKNMGRTDKIVRLIIAAALLILYATEVVEGTWGIIFLILAGILVLTSLVSFCPLYAPFHLHTNRNKNKQEKVV